MIDLPAGPFSIIYADPPWRFMTWSKDGSGQKKSPDVHYPTMTTEDVKLLPVPGSAAKDALLILWAYDPMLPQAYEVAAAWGFKPVTVFKYWNKITASGKPCFGLGYHTRSGGTEQCLLFKRGKGLKVLNHSIRRTFTAPVREHSRKPDEVREDIVKIYGDVPRLEMFSRTTTPGWTVWGNEKEKF